MTEQEFAALADAELSALEAALEELDIDMDVETKPGGILELEFAQGSKLIVNRHLAAREIWVAARSGGFHFSPKNGQWLAGRDGAELWAVVTRCLREQSGQEIPLLSKR